jgi:hypothetical protein
LSENVFTGLAGVKLLDEDKIILYQEAFMVKAFEIFANELANDRQ